MCISFGRQNEFNSRANCSFRGRLARTHKISKNFIISIQNNPLSGLFPAGGVGTANSDDRRKNSGWANPCKERNSHLAHLQVWFSIRRAKYRKKERMRKGLEQPPLHQLFQGMSMQPHQNVPNPQQPKMKVILSELYCHKFTPNLGMPAVSTCNPSECTNLSILYAESLISFAAALGPSADGYKSKLWSFKHHICSFLKYFIN